MKKLIRAAAYVRVSHEEQRKHGFSVEAQKKGLQKYAKEQGYIIVDWYIDEGYSARKKSKTRKELIRLLEDAKQNKFKMIIFKCIDRWFRNIAEYHKTQEVLEENKIDWECSEEEYDTTTREGRLKLNLYLMLAQDEADRGSERIKYVFEDKVKRGESIFSSHSLPYGIITKEIEGIKRVVIDKGKEHIVNDVFALYETIQSKGKVLDIVNLKHNADLSYKQITGILSSTLYCGRYKDNSNYVYGKHYLTPERWNRIQEILKSNVYESQNKRNYLFSRMIKCEECNYTLAGQTTEKNDRKWIYYKCNHRRLYKDCKAGRNIKEYKAEEALLKQIKPFLEKYMVKCSDPKLLEKPKVNTKSLAKERDRLNIQFRKGRISEKEYDEEFQRIEDIINSSAEEKPKDISYLKDILESDIETIYSSLSREEKAMFWRSIIKSVKFDPATYEIMELDIL